MAVAAVALPNEASLVLHRKMGFRVVGTFEEYARGMTRTAGNSQQSGSNSGHIQGVPAVTLSTMVGPSGRSREIISLLSY